MNIHLGTYAAMTFTRPAAPTALDAALALWALNFDAKSEQWWRAPTLYRLKARLLEALFRSGYCLRVQVDEQAVGLWWLTFVVDGVKFDWHLPPAACDDWLVACDEPLPARFRLPWRVDGTHDALRATVRGYLRANGGTR